MLDVDDLVCLAEREARAAFVAESPVEFYLASGRAHGVFAALTHLRKVRKIAFSDEQIARCAAAWSRVFFAANFWAQRKEPIVLDAPGNPFCPPKPKSAAYGSSLLKHLQNELWRLDGEEE